MYKPLTKLFFIGFSLFIIYSCTPRSIANEDILNKIVVKDKPKKIVHEKVVTKQTISNPSDINFDPSVINEYNNKKISSEIEIILPEDKNQKITKNFINSLELSVYKKNIRNLSFNINTYSQKNNLYKIIGERIQPGKIFIGPLTSNDTNNIKDFCSSGAIFFSFASDRSLASECVYLINFFPEDDLRTLFQFFDSNVRIALLYPEDNYGYYISNIIDKISVNSQALVVSKASYNKDISNARDAIKQLGKYESRRLELERQKKILQNKNDEISKKALKKIEKFETIGELDFTHVIIADYNIRLLEIVPLLPFYDIDPNKIQFVGTGVWDDKVFFDEPSLQKAIFPGVSKDKRKNFIEEYIAAYKHEPIRTTTIMYDLVGLLNYVIDNKLTLESMITLLNNKQSIFEGIDGKFSFENNLIKRELDVLQIKEGKAILIN